MSTTTLAERITQIESTLQELTRHETDQCIQLYDPAGTSCSAGNVLQDSLDRLEKTILNLCAFSLSKMTASKDTLEAIEGELDDVSGSLEAIRSRAGRELVTPSLPVPPMKAFEDHFLPRTLKFDLSFPAEHFTINLAAYHSVGIRVENETDNTQPLVRKLETGQSMPILWSRTADFFLSPLTATLPTSFADAYGLGVTNCFALPTESGRAAGGMKSTQPSQAGPPEGPNQVE
jgi:hypothetical protein